MKKGYSTITYKGLKLDLEFDYTERITGRLYLDNGDAGYEDEGGEVYVTKVELYGNDITDLVQDQIEDIEEAYKEQKI